MYEAFGATVADHHQDWRPCIVVRQAAETTVSFDSINMSVEIGSSAILRVDRE